RNAEPKKTEVSVQEEEPLFKLPRHKRRKVRLDFWGEALTECSQYLIHQNTKWIVGLKHQHILEWEETINEIKNTTDVFLGGNHLFFHQTLELDYSLNHDPKNEDSVHRLTMLYRIMDDLKSEISTVHFDPSDSSSGILSH
ncbi:MAG: hypothetical protein VXZ12_08145, partial [SAR324 cluster bacterium]|nr:hypothetical protein [SAR324 cluster bacterium]